MELAEVPCPQVGSGQVLIQTRASLISAGTERMLVEFSKANLLQKASQQPDKVKQVLDKIRADGLLPTLEAVFRKLDEPLPLGYCNAGVVLEAGSGVSDLQPGDRVISNGNHAEVVCVPRNLVARIPDGVGDEAAAFTVLGAIAMQGIRLVQPTLGEKVMVFGMGLIGLVTVQLLRANGCEVIGVDFNTGRLKLAESFGVKTVDLSQGGDPVAASRGWTRENGVDAVIVTASSKTDEIMHQAAESCRKRGRIVLVGVVGLNLRRDDFFKKELTFQVSASYGPGRYDEKYEQKGQDYPLGLVRWTEGRNFEAVLGAMASGSLKVDSLITHRYQLGDALQAYDKIQNDSSALGVILQYPKMADRSVKIAIPQTKSAASSKVVVGVIGAGNFSVGVILPCLKKTDARLKYVCGKSNAHAVKHAAAKFSIENALTDYRVILDDKEVNTVFIATGHNTHAQLVTEAMAAGKHVFVEKPLCICEDELAGIAQEVQKHAGLQLMVGFNRRFSQHTQKIRQLLDGRGCPLTMNMTVNAGEIPADNWLQDPRRGGGRIIGEACHFIDLLSYIAGSPVRSVSAMMVGDGPAVREDKMAIMLGFADGSMGTLNYFANGSKSYPKETLEVFSDGRVLKLENFRVTSGFGFRNFRKLKTWSQDKGHQSEIRQFVGRVEQGGAPMIPFEQIENVTRASFAAMTSASENRVIKIGSLTV